MVSYYFLNGKHLTSVYLSQDSELRDGRLVKYLFLGNQRIARSAQVGGDFAAEQLYLHNHLGSTELTVSGAGQPQTALSYTPYGELLHEFGNLSETPYRFAGKETDAESALAYFEQRYLNSRWGRFISPDPVLNLPARFSDPQRWNAYGYARGNPVTQIDPNGESAVYFQPMRVANEQHAQTLRQVDQQTLSILSDFAPITGVVKSTIAAIEEPTWANMADVATSVNPASKLVSKGLGALSKVTKSTGSVVDGIKLNRKLTLDEIVDHSFEKHVLKQGEFTGLGIRTKTQFRAHVDDVLSNPSSIRYYKDGRSAYLQESTGTVVIRNPTGSGQSTAFRPRDWNNYTNNVIPSRTVPHQ